VKGGGSMFGPKWPEVAAPLRQTPSEAEDGISRAEDPIEIPDPDPD
jgi:hypothetical protein